MITQTHVTWLLPTSPPLCAFLSLLPRSSILLFLFFFLNNHFCYLFIYLFMAVLGLRFCARAFSSCGKWGPLFIAVRGPLTVAASLLLRSTGSRHAGSVVVAHGPSCSAARGILPDQGLNPCPLHWQADSQPLRHQGSPTLLFLIMPSSFPVQGLCTRCSFPICTGRAHVHSAGSQGVPCQASPDHLGFPFPSRSLSGHPV